MNIFYGDKFLSTVGVISIAALTGIIGYNIGHVIGYSDGVEDGINEYKRGLNARWKELTGRKLL